MNIITTANHDYVMAAIAVFSFAIIVTSIYAIISYGFAKKKASKN